MSEIKDILIFISFSFRRFFTNFMLYLAYFFPVLILIVFVYFFSLRRFGNCCLFIIVLVILMIVHLLIRKKLFLKRQLILNLMFVDFLKNKDKTDFTLTAAEDLSLKKLPETKTGLKKEGAGFISHKLLLAVAAVRLKEKEDAAPLSREKLEKLKQSVLKYNFFGVLIFFILLVPFVFISFLFTRGLAVSIQMMIYLLGVFFVYFLYSAVFDPIIYLIIQAEAYKAKI